MKFWDGGAIANLLFLGSFLLVAVGVRKLIPQISKWAVPDSVIAGSLGFIIGPSVLALLPVDQDIMETLAYHGLAIAFVAVGLQEPIRQKKAGGARSFIFGIPTLGVVQGIVGLLFVLAWSAFALPSDSPLHPGFGIMVPLGFSQGPGQALSLGSQWETPEVPLAQIGLIMAALGFAWCCLMGVLLVGLARRKGWLTPVVEGQGAEVGSASAIPQEEVPPGGMEPLTKAVAAIASVYLLAYGALLGLDSLLEEMPNQQRLIWGFHFIIASIIAMSSRVMFRKVGAKKMLNDRLLARLAGLVVDITTVSALCAIKIEVLKEWLTPILLVTVAAGTVTLVLCLWLAKRAFPESPFEHALVLFGTSTGNLPTGLTLLRILDPELKGPVAANIVVGASAAVIPGAPLLIVVMPYAINRFPEVFAGAVWVNIAMMVGYFILLLVLWRLLAPLRFIGPLSRLWPESDRT